MTTTTHFMVNPCLSSSYLTGSVEMTETFRLYSLWTIYFLFSPFYFNDSLTKKYADIIKTTLVIYLFNI